MLLACSAGRCGIHLLLLLLSDIIYLIPYNVCFLICIYIACVLERYFNSFTEDWLWLKFLFDFIFSMYGAKIKIRCKYNSQAKNLISFYRNILCVKKSFIFNVCVRRFMCAILFLVRKFLNERNTNYTFWKIHLGFLINNLIWIVNRI